MKRIVKGIFTLFLLLILGILIYINSSLYYQPSFQTAEHTTINGDILHQLNFLQDARHHGAASDMQRIYPEGFVFMNALYGLTWADFARLLPQHSGLHQRAIEEIDWSLRQIYSPTGRSNFYASLPLANGAFYSGWSNFLLGKKLSIQPLHARNPTEVRQFIAHCNEIAGVIAGKNSPFPETYANAAWPADGILCVSSLALHDKIFYPQYRLAIEHWVRQVKTRLDPATGLVSHAVDHLTGKVQRGARGSSQSLIISFLGEMDPAFAKSQFNRYKKLFLHQCLGLPGIKEYPKGTTGAADIDSGPVICQIGGAATIVAIRTMRQFGEKEIADGIRRSIEGFGMPINRGEQKKYVFGQLPMADAFIAWASIQSDNTSGMIQPQINPWWRLPFQLFSFALFILILFLGMRIWSKTK